ncbi:MAG: hypothetical protein L0216_09980 [Planctomycetales bacterium]|nr:hypothetical protein [Planctomycetales bacterium]
MKKLLLLIVILGLGGGAVYLVMEGKRRQHNALIAELEKFTVPADPYHFTVKVKKYDKEKKEHVWVEEKVMWEPKYDEPVKQAWARRTEILDRLLALAGDKSAPPKKRIAAAMTLGHSNDLKEQRDTIVAALVSLLSEEGERVSEFGAFSLGKLVYPKGVYPKCGELLTGSSPEFVRYNALIAIRDTRENTTKRVYDETGTKDILTAFEDKSPKVRALAAAESQHITAKDDTEKVKIVDMLFKLVADADAAVSDAATDSLRRRVEDIPKAILEKEADCLAIYALPHAHAKTNALLCVTFLNDTATSNPIGEKEKPTLKLYMEALHATDLPVLAVGALGRGLAKYGSDADARTVAEWLLKRDEPEITEKVLEGLRARAVSNKGQRTVAVLGVLAEAAKKPEGPGKLAALKALGLHGAKDEARLLLDLWKAGVTDPVKAALIEGLRAIAGESEKLGDKIEDWEIWFRKKYKG